MTLGVDLLLFIASILIIWCIFAVWIKRLYGEKKVICASCNRRVTSLGLPTCPKCGGVLYKDYYEDKFYKR